MFCRESSASCLDTKPFNRLGCLDTFADQFGVPAAGLQVINITRRSNKDMMMNNKENVEEKTNMKLIELTRDISKKLREEVVSEEVEEIIGMGIWFK